MPPKNTNEQILVVDDDEAIRWTLREALESWGFSPNEAGTVEEAVVYAQTYGDVWTDEAKVFLAQAVDEGAPKGRPPAAAAAETAAP